MARAASLEIAVAGGGGGGGRGGGSGGGPEGERGVPLDPLVRSSICRLELPRPAFNPWSSLLTTTSTGGTADPTDPSDPISYSLHLHQNQTPPLAQQLHPGGPLMPRPPLPPCTRREEEVMEEKEEEEEEEGRPMAEARFCSGEQPAEESTDPDREEQPEAPGARRPPPHRQPPSRAWASAHGLGLLLPPGEVAVEEEEIRRVAHQLRTIGDQIHTNVLRRANAAPQWRDWRSAGLQLLNFVTQTLNALYRLT